MNIDAMHDARSTDLIMKSKLISCPFRIAIDWKSGNNTALATS